MSGFYVSMIFIGILLVLVSLILIFIDRKNIFDFKKSADEKKQELTEIINDAEQMIEELNRFSSYIVDQMDLKNDELNSNIREAEQRIAALARSLRTAAEEQPMPEAGAETSKAGTGNFAEISKTGTDDRAVLSDTNTGKAVIPAIPEKPVNETAAAGVSNPLTAARPAGSIAAAYNKNNLRTSPAPGKRDKIIQFNKYQEVLRLSKEGMNELDIAKNLNMGKGEVELIIGLRR